MTILTTAGRRQPTRIAPNEFRDAVELYARQFGGHGDVVWVGDPINCWQVRLTLSPGDPRLRGMEGEVFETVELQEFVHPDSAHPAFPATNRGLLKHLRRDTRGRLLPSFVAMELDDLGVSGLVEILERGSVFSGRGEFKSAEDAMQAVLRRERDRRERMRLQNRQQARDVAVATRRRILKIPFIPVGIELRRPEKEA